MVRPKHVRDMTRNPKIREILNLLESGEVDPGRLAQYLQELEEDDHQVGELDPAQQDGCYGQGRAEMDQPLPDGPETHSEAPRGREMCPEPGVLGKKPQKPGVNLGLNL